MINGAGGLPTIDTLALAVSMLLVPRRLLTEVPLRTFTKDVSLTPGKDVHNRLRAFWSCYPGRSSSSSISKRQRVLATTVTSDCFNTNAS